MAAHGNERSSATASPVAGTTVPIAGQLGVGRLFAVEAARVDPLPQRVGHLVAALAWR